MSLLADAGVMEHAIVMAAAALISVQPAQKVKLQVANTIMDTRCSLVVSKLDALPVL